jgi:hypothetical protein
VTDIPVVLFTHARPDHLKRTLDCLRSNEIPLLYAFSDGPRGDSDAKSVDQVRELLHSVTWTQVKIVERTGNLGLGTSILTGVREVFTQEDSAIIFEDDLICVPGTYQYLCAALTAYEHDSRIMSVTGWTHPRIVPQGVRDQPYFDGRAECWVWGAWARSWSGMDRTALELMQACTDRGIDVRAYGDDLVTMAHMELDRNIWAVRFLFNHLVSGSVCMRPPWSMVDHIGFDDRATNAVEEIWLKQPPLRMAPPIPQVWPVPAESPECRALHQAVTNGGNKPQEVPSAGLVRRLAARVLRGLSRPA